jgi:nitrogen fixation/metabolism regulation signal transduction histidine kinase
MDKTTSTIIERVKSMDIMVSSFADYANSPEIVTKLTDLNALIRKSVSLYDVVSDANINLHLSDSIPNILLDSSSIDRVIINLIKNACEAIEVGKHMEIDITTEHLNKENKVLLKIEDDGVGFDDSVIDKVFDPYITTKQEGTGLGMAIVHNIIREHGANIAASNKEPMGARIIIEFNCKKLK